MFEPVLIGFGGYMTAFYESLVPTTHHMHEFIARGVGKSIIWAPGRLVDQAEEMLASWQRNDTDSAPTQPAKLPVIIVGVAKDYTPTGREFTRQITSPTPVLFHADEKDRVFHLRCIACDIRAQVVIIAQDMQTAKSIAAQLMLFLDSPLKRRFRAVYPFAGMDHQFPVQIESPDTPAINVQTEVKNVTILAIDLTLKAQIPLFDAPLAGDPNDGNGVPGTDDPAGYPVLIEPAVITPAEALP